MWQVVWMFLSLTTLGHGEDMPSVVIKQGRLQGTFLETRGGRQISAFQGIPYASPPVGQLRFQKPLPAAPWEGELNATLPGSHCIQLTRNGDVLGDEDCLYINVYTHKVSSKAKLPVLVFIHGGAFSRGAGDRFQPTLLMDKDIVFVSFNYRLGPLGFLSMENKELPGNFGMKDQTAALRWVQDNIAEFGGDPDKVTLCGESAGGGSVHLHMLSPLSKGLFHRAIAQSGSALSSWAVAAPGQLQAVSERLAALVGCNHFSTADILDCLRDIPTHVLIEIVPDLYEWGKDPLVLFHPAIEPSDVEEAFLTSDPWTQTSDIPWIVGVTSGEGSFKVKEFKESHIIELNNDFEMIGPLSLLFRSTADNPIQTAFAIKKFYFLDGDIKSDGLEGLINMYSDAWFIYAALESCRRHRGPKYFYYFDYRGANSIVPQFKEVSHFDDMPYLFPLQHTNYFKNYNITKEDIEMSEKLVELWTNFVIYGTPTTNSSDITWDEATTGSEYLHIKKDGFTMEKDLLKERDEFWKTLPYRNKYLAPEKLKDEL